MRASVLFLQHAAKARTIEYRMFCYSDVCMCETPHDLQVRGINYHCPRCFKLKRHMRQIFGANEYLTCCTCGNVVHFVNSDHHEITHM